ncbi:hypothetical protein KC909_02045 [Candidatus Dojkabacteria bacterium]|uniref:Uncharacterized protein n=1 Tax=Candidatus Dojkabacteria bacterium TaxID=2099670 RepID=A0A955L569_9BACT|nr:hypothetical protein [Candidatus Dojkabacteria bacterium]
MENQNVSKNIDKEIARLDQQIADAKQFRAIIQEEQKPIYSVYKWIAPERVFETRDRTWYVIVASIAMAVIIYSALTGNYLLIIAVIALILLLYALNSIPPEKVTHEITNKGLNVFERLILWKDITSFWVTRRNTHVLINFEVKEGKDVDRIILLEGEGDAKKIVSYIVQHVDYLSQAEIGMNIIGSILEGKYVPLIRFLESDDIVTKDPKDSPLLNQQTKTTSK